VETSIDKQLTAHLRWRTAFREEKIRIPSKDALILIQVQASSIRI
jgi:hypothetical protein